MCVKCIYAYILKCPQEVIHFPILKNQEWWWFYYCSSDPCLTWFWYDTSCLCRKCDANKQKSWYCLTRYISVEYTFLCCWKESFYNISIMLNILTWDTEVNGSEVYLWRHPWWNSVGSVIELSFQIIFYDPDESLQNIGMFTQLHMNTNCPTASNPWNKTQLIPTWCYPVWPNHRFKKEVAFACHYLFPQGRKMATLTR